MIRKLLAVPAILMLLHGAPAQAAEAKKSMPVDIEADRMEIIDADKKAVFTGNVHAVRGDTVLTSNAVTVTYAEVKQTDGTTKTDATDIDARGCVVIKTKKETITGDWAKINPQTNKMVVGGNVKLVQGATVLTGPELHADLDTNKIEFSGGRVKGSFLPK